MLACCLLFKSHGVAGCTYPYLVNIVVRHLFTKERAGDTERNWQTLRNFRRLREGGDSLSLLTLAIPSVAWTTLIRGHHVVLRVYPFMGDIGCHAYLPYNLGLGRKEGRWKVHAAGRG